MIKFINILFTTIFIAALLGVAGLLVGSMLPIPGNIEIKIVKSGSMEPAIPTGSLVIVKPSSSFSYSVGDVITFGPDTASEIPTTHRIVAVEGTGSERIFITKGDANEEIDQDSVALREVIGKVLVHVPGAGFVLDFARQPLGFALLIGLPAGLIILEEIITIAKEARAALRRRRGEDDTPKGGAGSVDEEGAPLRLFYGRERAMDEIFIPMYMKPQFMHAEWWHTQFRMHKDTYGTSTALVLGLVFMSSMMAGGAGGTISYFSDIERSIGNVFRAGEWSPPVLPEQMMFAAVLGTTTEDLIIEEEEAPHQAGSEIPEDPTSSGGGGDGSGGAVSEAVVSVEQTEEGASQELTQDTLSSEDIDVTSETQEEVEPIEPVSVEESTPVESPTSTEESSPEAPALEVI